MTDSEALRENKAAMPQLQLDDSLYSVSPAQKDFFKSYLSIESDSDLKDYILDAQRHAFAIFPCTYLLAAD